MQLSELIATAERVLEQAPKIEELVSRAECVIADVEKVISSAEGLIPAKSPVSTVKPTGGSPADASVPPPPPESPSTPAAEPESTMPARATHTPPWSPDAPQQQS